MNRILTILTGFLLVFAFAGTAGAVSYLYTDTYQPDQYMNSWCWGEENSSVSWTFDITDEASGYFDPTTQDVSFAKVGLTLEDDEGYDFIELAEFSVGQDYWWGEVDTGDYSFGLSVTSLAELNKDGTIDATLTSFLGDFNFKESTLYASTQPVPEPATMLLFGSGLVCLAGIARRRKSAKIRE